jgi:hypothetical protein
MKWNQFNSHNSSTNIYTSQPPLKDPNLYGSTRNATGQMYNSNANFPLRTPTNPSYTSNRVITRRNDFPTQNSTGNGLSTTKDSNGRFNQGSFQKKAQPNQSSTISNFSLMDFWE